MNNSIKVKLVKSNENVCLALEDVLSIKLLSNHCEPLASYHIHWFVFGYLRNVVSPLGRTISRLLVNRITTLPLQWLMRAGLRKHLPGHTLLVELEYRPD